MPPLYYAKARKLRFPATKEKVAVLYLSGRGKVRTTRWIATGSNGLATVEVDKLLTAGMVLQHRGHTRGDADLIQSFVLVHNHPSGELRPSTEDLKATVEIADAAQRYGMPMVDHLVYAGGKVASVTGHSGSAGGH